MKKTILFSGVALLALSLFGCGPTNVLLITPYPDGSPRVAEAEAAIRARMRAEDVPVHVRVVNTNMVGKVNDIWREELSKKAVVNVHSAEPDAVFVMGDDAARYFAQRVVDLPRRFIFFGIQGSPESYRLTGAPETQVTGVVEGLHARELFELIKQVVPSAHGVAVLSDGSLEGQAVVAKIRQASPLPLPVVMYKEARTLDEWMSALQEIQTKADALVIASYSEVLRTPTGSDTVPAAELLQLTNLSNKVPDFSFWQDAVGPHGVLAAVYVPIAAQAKMAADAAVKTIYYGKNILDIPIQICSAVATSASSERAAQLHVTLPAAPAAGAGSR